MSHVSPARRALSAISELTRRQRVPGPALRAINRAGHRVDPVARRQEGLRDDVCVVGLVSPAHGEAEDRVDVA
jgi:hypothetical protein